MPDPSPEAMAAAEEMLAVFSDSFDPGTDETRTWRTIAAQALDAFAADAVRRERARSDALLGWAEAAIALWREKYEPES